ncbi:MAG: reverse transcriptase family protein [Clostridium sp.]|jgi:retron-type reverse transcriptase|nr:reverse transcriptase family protein [Clostridium sp.]
MFYVTVMQSPMHHQMTLEELLYGDDNKPAVIASNESNTRTYEVKWVSSRFSKDFNISHLIGKLAKFNESVAELRKQDRASLYRTFLVPKRSGGLRRIDAPNPELMAALRQLKAILEVDFRALYHTSAFAYVKKRCTVDAVKRHQRNGSRWFGKLDLKDFFGSTTIEFVMSMLSMIFPFSVVAQSRAGNQELRTALELAFLNGGLPQGTPISPLVTNLMMIPIDFKLNKALGNLDGQKFIYTRYADDFLITSEFRFDIRSVEKLVTDTLKDFGAPFTVNASKTRFGSSSGRNWNLGIMLNKDNEITVGHKNKRRLQSMLHSYIMSKNRGEGWDKNDVQVLQGTISYYRMIEKKNIDAIIAHINEKTGKDVMGLIRSDLSGSPCPGHAPEPTPPLWERNR